MRFGRASLALGDTWRVAVALLGGDSGGVTERCGWFVKHGGAFLDFVG